MKKLLLIAVLGIASLTSCTETPSTTKDIYYKVKQVNTDHLYIIKSEEPISVTESAYNIGDTVVISKQQKTIASNGRTKVVIVNLLR